MIAELDWAASWHAHKVRVARTWDPMDALIGATAMVHEMRAGDAEPEVILRSWVWSWWSFRS